MLVADGRIALFGSRLVDWERGEKIRSDRLAAVQQFRPLLEPMLSAA
jgi:hypothetical protein